MKKLIFLFLAAAVLTNCSSDIEIPPPPDTSGNVSSSSGGSSSSSLQSSSSLTPSSSSSVLSSSSVAASSSSSSSVAESSSSNSCEDGKRLHFGMCKSEFEDERDGKKYVYVPIGTQVWMAENLNYNVSSSSGSVCYNNQDSYCETYGRLYSGVTAINNSICPEGWHLPSVDEWYILVKYVDINWMSNLPGGNIAGTKLKANSSLWNTNTGTNEFGFAALPGGAYVIGSFNGIGDGGAWWSSSEYGTNYANSWHISDGENVNVGDNHKDALLSVRCLQNSVP